ncbi:MAG: hypothetical protein HGA45_10105 [Chloroflexales bacterium]|nr:hypothetical protein [Chloroflexales bacterium]
MHTWRHLAWLGILLVIVTLAPASGQVTQAREGGYLLFETGRDGARIAVPGLALTGADGAAWVYGDVRTGAYNAPYPADCSRRPANIARPVCDFAVSGVGFAWLGQPGREGRIAFTMGTATYVEANFSTGTTLQLVAYGPRGEVVDAGAVLANNGTGNLDRVRLEGDAGEPIASVVIRGAPNFWLMDDFATDAPGVPNELGGPDTADPAHVVASQWLSLSNDPALGRLATYTVAMANVGTGDAEDAIVTLPFAPADLRVLDAAFSRNGPWVSSLVSDTLTLRSGPLPRDGGVITATLRFQLLRDFPADEAPGRRLAVTWSDRAGGGHGQSNLPFSVQPGGDPRLSLTVAPEAGPAGATHTFTSGLFVPAEPVALWYDTPRGVVEVGRITADGEGGIRFEFVTGGLAPGRYTMVAHGVFSGLTALGAFQVDS